MSADRAPLSARARFGLQVVGVLIGLFLVFWAADSGSRAAAESLIARDVQDATGATTAPDVTIRGRTFLLQLLRGAYSEVDVTTTGLANGPLRIERVDSRLLDVRVPFHDVLVQDVRRFGIGRSEETVSLLYSDLSNYLADTGQPVQLASAGGDQVKATGAIEALSQRLEIEADLSIGVSAGALRLTPTRLTASSGTLTRSTQLLIGQRLSVSIPLDPLPFGHRLADATASPEGITLKATGRAIVVQP